MLDGVGVHLSRWRRLCWLEVDNGDLWRELDALLQARAADSVAWMKVKGHARMADVRAGAVSLEEKRGNDAADVLARRGASQHRVSLACRAKRRNARRLAIATQRMMVDIFVARCAAQSTEALANESDGSSSAASERARASPSAIATTLVLFISFRFRMCSSPIAPVPMIA